MTFHAQEKAEENLRNLEEDYETWRWGIRNMQRMYRVPVSGGRQCCRRPATAG